MKTAQKSRKPSFVGVVTALRQHQYMAQGKPVRAVKTPGLGGNRKAKNLKTK